MAERKPKWKILIVDDDDTARNILARLLKDEERDVVIAADGREAFQHLFRTPFDVVLTDLVMDNFSGIDILVKAKEFHPETEVIVITGYGSVPTAIEAIKKGAFHYLEKPFKPEEVRHLVKQALEKSALKREISELTARLDEQARYNVLLGQSKEIKEVVKLVEQVAQADCNVLIIGESGTGKEVAARMIHRLSRRAQGKFLAINCGAFTEELLANELFGHEKDAFTGASSTKEGLMESASGGTLFLDEIGDMPLAMQIKLLRAIQEQEIIRVGGTKPIGIDLRIISATNQDLKKAISAGLFRQDLYYRLDVISIRMPALRERKADIPILANYFLERSKKRAGKPIKGFSEEAMEILENYNYPGNVRELENIVERAVALAQDEYIQPWDLPQDIREMEIFSFGKENEGIKNLEEIKHEYIQWVLDKVGRNKTKAAKLLGIDRASLWRYLKKFEIED